MFLQRKSRAYRRMVIILAAAAAAVFLFLCGKRGGMMTGENCGIPDVVSSVRMNGECRITVVANCASIEDYGRFKREVIRMYEENRFASTKFSRDMGELPERIIAVVYYQKKDIGRKPPVCRFSFVSGQQRRKLVPVLDVRPLRM